MTSTLDRYIIRSFAVNFATSLLAMIGLYVVLDFFFNLDEFVESARDFSTIARNVLSYYGCQVFLYYAQLAGTITLFAAAATLARMQKANELVGVLAAGVSLYRIAAPVIIAGLATNFLWLVDQEVIIPALAPRLARQHEDVEGRQARKVYFVEDRHNALLTALEFYPGEKEMRQMIVIRRDAQGYMTDVLRADRASWDEAARLWRLERGVLLQPASATGTSTREATKIPLDVYESDLTPEYLALRQAAQWVDLLSMRQLGRLADADYVEPRRVAQIRHGRFALPFMNLVLLALGIPFFLNRLPEGIIAQAGKCLLNCGFCFAVTFVSQQVIHSETYPALTAWFPLMVFGPLAVLYLDAIRT